MAIDLQMRVSAAGNETVGGATVPTVVLDRDLVELTGSIRAGLGEELQQVRLERTLAASAGLTISLRDPANTIVDAVGRPLQLQDVRFWMLCLFDANTTKRVHYGPLGISEAAPLWFGATGADSYLIVRDVDLQMRRLSPVPIAADAANVRFVNPSSTEAVTFRLWVVGRKV